MKYRKAMSLDLHLTHYTTNVEGVFVTLIRVYSGRVFVLDDVVTLEIGNRQIATDTISSKLVNWVMGVVELLYKEIEDPLEQEV